MKMKMKKNKSSAKKLIIILSLSLALIIALGAVTFAWIRNYIEVNTLSLETGKMLYNLKLYRIDENGNLQNPNGVPVFDTKDPDDAKEAESETCEKTLAEGKNLVEVNRGEEVFFVIEKYADSIDFDVAISFDNKGLEGDYTNIGEIKYQLCDEKNPITDVASYLQNPGENSGEMQEGLSKIFDIMQKTSLSQDKTYACIRLKLDRPAPTDSSLKIPLRVKFCVAQKDKLPNDTNPDIFEVYDKDGLKETMNKYGFGDEIRIMEDIEDYEGDLVFTRPCKLTVMHSTLTVKGNLSFSYIYDGNFGINTVSDGHIRIVKGKPDSNDERVGGNFRIDLPNSKIEISGANNDLNGKADIYVEGDFSANAANNTEKGLLFKGARICDISTTVNEVVESGKTRYVYAYDTKTDLKSMTVNGPSRISTSIRTNLGPILTNLYCTSISIENNGRIEKIDLENMVCDTTFKPDPAILIENAGAIGTAVGDAQAADLNNIILLPENSMKFDHDDTSSAADNVQIKANKGSEFIRALTKGSGDSIDKAPSSQCFFSNGNAGMDGIRDDIEYAHREVFVEAKDGDKTKITIHYEKPSAMVLDNDSSLGSLTGLKSYVDYYSAKGTIADVSDLTDVTIICYGEKVLTTTTTLNDTDVDDYEFIRTMKNIVTLDLSDAVSLNKSVPKQAFNGLTKLKFLTMSESDTVWGQNIFTGTDVDSITFPQSLTKLDNPTYSNGVSYAQKVLDGIKYVYTSVSTVDGFWYTDNIKNLKQHLFTPDEQTRTAYRNLYDNENWKSRIFLDNGVVNYNGFFLRLNNDQNNPTCEFVTYTEDRNANGERRAWIDETGFNFQTISISGEEPYTITKYDPYALYGKLIEPKSQIEDIVNRVNTITLSASVTEIGERAFANNKITSKSATGEALEVGFDTITLEGAPNIRGYAFFDNDALETFNAPNITALYGGYNLAKNGALKTFNAPRLRYVYADGDISKCENLMDVHISVIEKTESNKNFYTSSDDYYYSRFYIHTEYSDMNYSVGFTEALAADLRHIFVKESYANLYKNSGYTGITEMGEHDINQLLWADESGNQLSKVDEQGNSIDPATLHNLKYYYILDGDNARLVANLYDKEKDKKIDSVISTIGGKPVNYIGSAAYHFTPIVAQEIKIPDTVTGIGDYAFDSRGSSSKKYCITLDLNNVVTAGKGAFYYMDMAKVTGAKLTTVGENTFSYNRNLIVVNLPNLQNSRGGVAANPVSTVFVYANNLRVLNVSYSIDIEYDESRSRINNYIRFMNVVSLPDDKKPAFANTVSDWDAAMKKGVNTVMMANNKEVSKGIFDKAFIVINNWNLIKLSNYYEYSVDLGEVKGTLELPGYIYHQTGETGEGEEKTTELSLIATSPDIIEFGNFIDGDYITPGYLYLDDGRYTDKGDGGSKIKVTSIGSYAFGTVSFNNVGEFIVADTVVTLSDFALAGYAPIYNEATGGVSYSLTLKDIEKLNLSNVVNMGKRACYKASMRYLTAEKVSTLGWYTFDGCSRLENVFLPAYITADARGYTFNNCVVLEEITFGKKTDKFANQMFKGASNLQKVTILNSMKAVTLGGSFVDAKHIENLNKKGLDIVVSVPKAVYQSYMDTYSAGFGNIPTGKFKWFENSTTLGEITYYWNVISSEAGKETAYINYIDAVELPDTLDIPSQVWVEDENGDQVGPKYTVVSVSAQAMISLSGVSTVKLPSGMQYLSFSTADIPSTVTALEIENNDKFGTLDGVLYTKDSSGNLTTLLVYPKAKAATELTLASTVTEIASGAFYGAENLKTLNIDGNVTIYDRAFEDSAISNIKFTATSGVSVFAGRDIFLGVNLEDLTIIVPSDKLESYKANVLVDYEIIDRFTANS